MDREYEFFVTTNEPHQLEGQERGLIRRLVMRNFFETKWTDPTNASSEHTSASTVKSKKRLKSRFRLSKPGQEVAESKSASRRRNAEQRGSGEEGEKREKRPRATRKQSGVSETSEPDSSSSPTSRRGSLIDGESAEASKSKARLVLKINPSAHRFDPFNVLPVPGTPQLDILFKLYKSGSRANSIAINARNTWWSFISQDAGLLHATLATWALYGVLVQGISDLRVEELRHKNAAIKEINAKIGSHAGTISDELVGTVLTLASFENLVGAYDAAQLHIAALKRMVNARGGLFAFGHNDGLVRGMIWVDFHSAAAFHAPPSFPRIRLDPESPPLPAALLDEAAYTSPTSLLKLSVAKVECFNIFYRLHRLALAVSSQWLPKVNRMTLSDLLYETEYTILTMPDYSRAFLDLDLQAREDVELDHEEGARDANAASVVECLLAAAQIFIYAALREVPPKAKIFSIFLERLRVAVDRPNTSIVAVWDSERNVNLLLWVLVVASSVAIHWGTRAWWIARLAKVVRYVGISGEVELERELRRVAWTEHVFGDAIHGVWTDVERHVEGQRKTRESVESVESEGQYDLFGNVDVLLLREDDTQTEHGRGWWNV
ncbi:hypothetical protein EJ04DRAFT_496075 [Polyplosphaeria fusca]|uniref:Uncharacterized protein n=1 Tax=Polyplosphaeria fusca TaxID=682080 RepID=A0A9P4UY90_9PLEO|nr:hypothetical protein EJ04DRAFT_496075 [Polyplosphaeria fusca]